MMIKKYWWQYILAVPPNEEGNSFKRIYRIIADKTRYSKRRKDGSRLHEFYNRNHETHLTVTTWENFSIFDSYEWVNKLIQTTKHGLSEKVLDCNWSYEWEKRQKPKQKPRIKLLDVVINYRTEKENSIIIIESKNKKILLGDKDLDVDYYMKIDDFDCFDNVYLIYCIDEKVKDVTLDQIAQIDNIGIITWQELCSIQIEMVDTLEINKRIKMFLKASIYQQFLNFELHPSTIKSTYLENEVPMDEYVEYECKSIDMQRKIWKIK